MEYGKNPCAYPYSTHPYRVCILGKCIYNQVDHRQNWLLMRKNVCAWVHGLALQVYNVVYSNTYLWSDFSAYINRNESERSQDILSDLAQSFLRSHSAKATSYIPKYTSMHKNECYAVQPLELIFCLQNCLVCRHNCKMGLGL